MKYFMIEYVIRRGHIECQVSLLTESDLYQMK